MYEQSTLLQLPEMCNRLFRKAQMRDEFLPLLYDYAYRLDKVRHVHNPPRLSEKTFRRLA